MNEEMKNGECLQWAACELVYPGKMEHAMYGEHRYCSNCAKRIVMQYQTLLPPFIIPLNAHGLPCDNYNEHDAEMKEADATQEPIADLSPKWPPTIAKILSEIRWERAAQDKKWGEQNHNVVEWLAVLGEEFGEASEQALRIHFGGEFDAIDKYRKEVIQCAAVCVAMIECIDRNTRGWK